MDDRRRAPLNSGVAMDFYPPKPDGEEYAFGHDPHCVAQHPTHPDRLWHQNHCGVYRLDRPARRWERVGKNLPPEVGDVGFNMVLHPRDVDTAWVFPMDGTQDWPRTPPQGRPAVFRTRDAGASWERQDQGLPREQAWWTVKRQALCADGGTPLGLYLGNTGGELWASSDEGESWRCLFRHLPHIYAVSAGVP